MTNDANFAEVLKWQTRPLCCLYSVAHFDALRVQIQEGGVVRDKAVHLALGVLADGQHEILGLWIDPAPGAKGWPTVINQLKYRGVEYIRIVGVDGPKDLPVAIQTAYPDTKVQPSIAHLIRRSLIGATPRDQQLVAAALRPIHTASSALAAHAALDAFAAGPWGAKYPSIVRCWQAAWEQLIPFFALPPNVRRINLLAVDSLEYLHKSLSRKVSRHGHFRSDQAAIACVWLALRPVMQRRGRSVQAQPRRRLTARIAESPML